MKRRSMRKFFIVLLTVAALMAPVTVIADGGGSNGPTVINALCLQILNAIGVDTDRSNICPLTQNQYD